MYKVRHTSPLVCSPSPSPSLSLSLSLPLTLPLLLPLPLPLSLSLSPSFSLYILCSALLGRKLLYRKGRAVATLYILCSLYCLWYNEPFVSLEGVSCVLFYCRFLLVGVLADQALGHLVGVALKCVSTPVQVS